MIKKYNPIFILALFTTLLCMSMDVYSDTKEQTSNKGLVSTHSDISKKYKTVPHLKANEVIKMEKSSYVIFDVREKDEYDVSHIKDAIWIDPSIKASTFNEKFSSKIKDKTVILYCSVGVRSTRLAEKLLDSEENKLKIYNLENGIFGWHNESRPLFQLSKSTRFVHPYNRKWGRMVNRKELQRYKP